MYHRPHPALALLTALLALPTAARAADHHVELLMPNTAQPGITVPPVPSAAFVPCWRETTDACGGELRVRTATRTAIAAGHEATIQFDAPTGTTIAGGRWRLLYNLATPGMEVRVGSLANGSWTWQSRTDGGYLREVSIPAGATRVAVTLRARTAIASTAVTDPHGNELFVRGLIVDLRDTQAPTARVASAGPFDGSAWVRGGACLAAQANDVGLGVAVVALDLASRRYTLSPGAASPLLPGQPAASGDICVDSAALPDGPLFGILTATDAAGLTSAPSSVTLRVDNSRPLVAVVAPPASSERRPALIVTASDSASGLAAVAATLDGAPTALVPTGSGWQVRPEAPLSFAAHTLHVDARDNAGNLASTEIEFIVEDRIAPTVSGIRPADGSQASADARIQAEVRDAESGIDPDRVELDLDGRSIDVRASAVDDGRIDADPAGLLTPGVHRVRLVVADRSGNVTTARWSFTVPRPARQLLRPSSAPGAPGSSDSAGRGGWHGRRDRGRIGIGSRVWFDRSDRPRAGHQHHDDLIRGAGHPPRRRATRPRVGRHHPVRRSGRRSSRHLHLGRVGRGRVSRVGRVRQGRYQPQRPARWSADRDGAWSARAGDGVGEDPTRSQRAALRRGRLDGDDPRPRPARLTSRLVRVQFLAASSWRTVRSVTPRRGRFSVRLALPVSGLYLVRAVSGTTRSPASPVRAR